MTREAFIRKWLANKDFQYCEDGRAQMREDLDKVIEHAQPPTIASVIGKRLLSIEWQAKEAIERLTTLTHEVDELKSACASGAVDKTVSGDFSCGCKTPNDCKELTNCALHNKYGRA